MTEEDWLTTDDFDQLRSHLWETEKKRPRKYRLSGCGIFRLVRQDTLNEEESRLLELGEAFADDPSFADRVKAADSGVVPETFPFDVYYPFVFDRYDSNNVARVIPFLHDRFREHWREQRSAIDDDEQEEAINDYRRQTNVAGVKVVRDIFGNPFHPISADPKWLTSTVVALAEGTYQERAFDRMPILADALEEAGCDNADILNHCRGDGPHVRGCWVVDLLTGRT